VTCGRQRSLGAGGDPGTAEEGLEKPVLCHHLACLAAAGAEAPRRIIGIEIFHRGVMAHEPEHEHGNGHGLAVETSRPEVMRPPLFQVVLLNDDFTPMDFVVEVLRSFFGLDQEKAVQVMLHVHTRGKGVCGVFTREVAETKVTQVNEYSRAHQHPLLCTMEKV
jgi:ATP-dependent Clp protease adaptor protein ClpS